MKRKLLSLLLCLTLCIPLALTSCLIPDLSPKPEEKTFIDDIICTWDKKESFDALSSFVPEGTVAGSNEKFVYTVGLDYPNEGAGLIADKTHYRIYNKVSGALIFEDSVIYNIDNLSYTSASKAISITLLDKMIMVIKTSAESGEEAAFFFDENGNELLTTSDTALTIIDEDRIVLNHKLYVLNNGVLEFKKDLRNSQTLSQIISYLEFVGDRYIYIDNYSLVYVLDENYNFLYKKPLKQTLGSTYAEEKFKHFTLANGNIISQMTYYVGDYSSSIEPYTYDYISGGKCYKVDSFLLDIRKNTYKEIELPYILTTVIPVKISGVNISLPFGAQNIGAGQRIDAKKLVSTGGATYASFLLYDDGSVRGMPSVDENANIAVISENRFITENDFYVKVYNENAQLIGTLDSYDYYNNKFIITGTEILNHNLEVVYSLTSNNAAVDFFTADSVIITAFDKETRTSTKYLITDGAEPKAISTQVELIVRDNFYATIERNDGISKLTVYKTNGDAIGEFSIDEDAEVLYSDYEGYSILETKNLEGKSIYITVFKAIAN